MLKVGQQNLYLDEINCPSCLTRCYITLTCDVSMARSSLINRKAVDWFQLELT